MLSDKFSECGKEEFRLFGMEARLLLNLRPQAGVFDCSRESVVLEVRASSDQVFCFERSDGQIERQAMEVSIQAASCEIPALIDRVHRQRPYSS